MQQTEKRLRLKNQQGRVVQVTREHYVRDDIPCCSPLCLAECAQGEILLPSEASHYLVPDCDVAQNYLDILQLPQFRGIILLHTVMQAVQHEGGRRHYQRVKKLLKEAEKQSVMFHNEFQRYSYCPRQSQEALKDWQARSVYEAACWYHHHLAAQMPIVMLTSDPAVSGKYGGQTEGVLVLCMDEYLQQLWPQLEEAHSLYHSIQASLSLTAPHSQQEYEGYLASELVESGLKNGTLIQGCLQVNKHHSQTEAFIRTTGASNKSRGGASESCDDILIHGMWQRNRAVHGDIVVVALLPRMQWRSRSNAISGGGDGGSEPSKEKDESGDESEERVAKGGPVMPTARVVAVLQRNWRDYVCAFPQNTEECGKQQQQRRGAGKVLVVPWDWRIPKIRISTRQADTLRDHRIVVRIDSWEAGSQYPNGHFVRSLGVAGDVETEVQALLLENSISVLPFSEAQLKELPVNSEEKPWVMDAEEIGRRRDLRESHLVFSIDPKGCEDVDDTLSIRRLADGGLELGVHIADVSHFVSAGSLSDQEARARSTTVYLADRRYDMLPPVLSADLCSLVSGKDRYAVSVLWQLDAELGIQDVWYGRTVIRSAYKLYYELAQEIHEGADDDHLIDNIPELQHVMDCDLPHRLSALRWSINKLMEVAQVFQERRTNGGALTLDSTEVQVQLSTQPSTEPSTEAARTIDALVPKQSLAIHHTIAECMITANHWVARKIAQAFPNSALLRHHPLPRESHFEALVQSAAAKGFHIDTTSNKALADSLDLCHDPQDPNVNKLLRQLATQAMSNASYFSCGSLPRDQFFHYGLALDYYTHFTSPIRRYADVLVHRQLLACVEGSSGEVAGNVAVEAMARHMNCRHRAAQEAQRASLELFQALYFRQHAARTDLCTAQAVVLMIRSNGLIVFVPRYGVKGAVFLQSKDKQVLYVSEAGMLEWTGGRLIHSQTAITVDSLFGQQTYTLFDHITVRLSVLHSHAHASKLRVDLVDRQSHAPTTNTTAAKQEKQLLIQEVHSIAEERQKTRETVELGDNFQQLQKMYGQRKNSFYQALEKVKKMAIAVDS